MRKALFIAVLMVAAPAAAAPNPTSITGTPTHDATITINGTNFGSKISPIDGTSLPWGYWDFEDGTMNPVDALSAGSVALTDQNLTVTVEARGSSIRILKSDSINWAEFSNGGIVSVLFNFPDQDVGQKQYFSCHRYSARSDYSHTHSGTGALDMDENWKMYRGFPTSGSTYPNTVMSQAGESASSCTGGGSRRFSVEGDGASNYTDSDIRLPGPTWMEEEYYFKYNTVDFGTSGILRLRQDGVATFDKTDYAEDRGSFTTDDLQRQFMQDDPANMNDCGGDTVAHVVKYDDCAADYGTYAPARVMLGDASTLAACTTLEYQPAITWSSTAIQVKVKKGGLPASATGYLYVFDSDDVANASGLLAISGAGNPAPTLASISTSSGSSTGNESFSVSGTGFLSGMVISFGSNNASSVVVVSGILATGLTPAGTPATTVNVTVENTDGQEAAGPTYTYAALPENPIYSDPDPVRDDGSIPTFRR